MELNPNVQQILNDLRSSQTNQNFSTSNPGFNDNINNILEESRRNRQEIEKRSMNNGAEYLNRGEITSYQVDNGQSQIREEMIKRSGNHSYEYTPHQEVTQFREEVVKRSGAPSNVATTYEHQEYRPQEASGYNYQDYKPQEVVYVQEGGNFSGYDYKDYKPEQRNEVIYETYKPEEHHEVLKKSGNLSGYDYNNYKPEEHREVIYENYQPQTIVQESHNIVREEVLKKSGAPVNSGNYNYSETPYDYRSFNPKQFDNGVSTTTAQYETYVPQNQTFVSQAPIEDVKIEKVKQSGVQKQIIIESHENRGFKWCC